MTIKMNEGQAAAFEEVKKWLRTRSKFFLLRGYAGVGKTTMAMEIAKWADREAGLEVQFAAPTNKAVRVLQAKLGGLPYPAGTVHQAIYCPDEETGEFTMRHGGSLKVPKHGLLIVDECSMISGQMLLDLEEAAREAHLHILFMGDDFQLPPVNKKGEPVVSTFARHYPQARLTQVMRQADGSGVLEMATAIRAASRPLVPSQESADVRFLPSHKAIIEAYAADLKTGVNATCIAWRNATRVNLNNSVRVLLFGGDLRIHQGERVMGLDNGNNLVNGEEATLPQCHVVDECDTQVKVWKNRIPTMMMAHLVLIEADDNSSRWIVVTNWQEASLQRTSIPAYVVPENWREKVKTWNGKKEFISKEVNLVTFGYVLTAHKSQGSQWDRVYIAERQSGSFAGDVDQARWFYTAVTRAAKDIVLFQALCRNGVTWEQIHAEAAPFMSGSNTVQKEEPVAQPKAEVKAPVEKPVAETKKQEEEDLASSFAAIFAGLKKPQQKKVEVKKPESQPKQDINATFSEIFANAAKKEEKKVESAAKSTKKEAKKEKKVIDTGKVFIPVRKDAESDRDFILRIFGLL